MKASDKLIVLPRGDAPKRGATGRPSTYTASKAAEICERMVSGQSLRTICSSPGMPGLTTLFEWRSAHREFAEQYAHAREAQADAHVEEILEVARKAVHAKTSEEVQGYKLLIDALKWRASKMKPRSYGDKVTLDGEVSVRQMSDEELNRRLAYLLSEMRKPERLVDAGESTTRLLGDSATEGAQ